MKQLSESVGNILQNVTPDAQKRNTSSRGLTVRDGMKNTALIIPRPTEPLTIQELRTTNCEIESMQQQNLLTISAVTRQTVSKGFGFEHEETGEYNVTISNLSEKGMQSLVNAITPAHKQGVQNALEILAQIKPIGSSHVKQATVISYLAFDLFDAGISEFVVHEVCKDYRQSLESKFFPDSAEFLAKAKRHMKKWQKTLETAMELKNDG